MAKYFKVSLQDVIIVAEEFEDVNDVYTAIGDYMTARFNQDPIESDEEGRIDNAFSAFEVSENEARLLGVQV